ncbi:MAG: hypothetical protein KJ623_02925 [Nanoarchaeota archaeon]|nr:hypothetical protein [Nanoarchaeota archaeon]MBU0963239.1 hypothetical protein [Nanoarchaeota archaeon]
MTIKGVDIMAKELNTLYNLGLKDYEINYLMHLKQKDLNKRHWLKFNY